MTEYGVGLAALIVVVLVAHNQPRMMAVLIVLAMYVSRPSVEIGGLNIRAEMLVGALCGLLLIGHKGHAKALERPRGSPSGAVASTCAWLLGGALSTWYMAPDWKTSASVVLWCTLNFFTAFWIYRNPESWEWIVTYGIRVGAWISAVAIAAWLMAGVGVGGWGVQADPAYGGYAAFVTSIEANILGGLICLWTLVAIMRPRGVRLAVATPLLQLLGPLAILVTHTRAALIAYVVGLVILRVSGSVNWSWTTIGPVILGVPALLAYSDDEGFSKFGSLVDVESGTGALRFETNSLALEEWVNVSPTLGMGWNTFGQRHFDPSRPTEYLPSYLGNLPLQVAYDGGVVAVLLVCTAALLTLVSLKRAGRLRYALGLGVPYLLFSISTSALWLLETWIFVGLAWGACIAEDRARRPEGARSLAG